EESVVVVCGDGRPARRRRLGVAEGLPERLELRRGDLSDQRRDREPAAGVLAAALSDLRARLEEAAKLVGRERVAVRRFLVARGGEGAGSRPQRSRSREPSTRISPASPG